MVNKQTHAHTDNTSSSDSYIIMHTHYFITLNWLNLYDFIYKLHAVFLGYEIQFGWIFLVAFQYWYLDILIDQY